MCEVKVSLFWSLLWHGDDKRPAGIAPLRKALARLHLSWELKLQQHALQLDPRQLTCKEWALQYCRQPCCSQADSGDMVNLQKSHADTLRSRAKFPLCNFYSQLATFMQFCRIHIPEMKHHHAEDKCHTP